MSKVRCKKRGSGAKSAFVSLKQIFVMNPRILCFQFRKNPTAVEQERRAIEREAGTYCEITFLDSHEADISWNKPETVLAGYTGVILGGSGDYDFDGGRPLDDPARLESQRFLTLLQPLFRHLFEHDVPTLGICFGHQLLGAFAGAQVRFDEKQKKMRSHELRLMVDAEEHFLFSGLPETLHAQYGHKDSLDRVPDGATLLMTGGEACQISALRYRENIYTTQFHPELTGEDLVNRLKNSPGYLPEGVVVEELVTDDPNSNRILRNFSKFVAERSTPQGGGV